MREARPENLGERFGDPGGPDPGEATSSAASASSMRQRAAQELSPEMGRMGAEDPSRALPDEPPLAPAYYATRARGWRRDIWALLHPPYTAWHLSYVLIGAGLAGRIDVPPLLATLAAFFFVGGVSRPDRVLRPDRARFDRISCRRRGRVCACVRSARAEHAGPPAAPEDAVGHGHVDAHRRFGAAARRARAPAPAGERAACVLVGSRAARAGTGRGEGPLAGRRARKALDGSSAPMRPIFGFSFCAARSRINGCARCAARRFTRISATWIAESLAEGFRSCL